MQQPTHPILTKLAEIVSQYQRNLPPLSPQEIDDLFPPTYDYLVCYRSPDNQLGRTFYYSDKEICSVEDVEAIEQFLLKHTGHPGVVLTFQLLQAPEVGN